MIRILRFIISRMAGFVLIIVLLLLIFQTGRIGWIEKRIEFFELELSRPDFDDQSLFDGLSVLMYIGRDDPRVWYLSSMYFFKRMTHLSHDSEKKECLKESFLAASQAVSLDPLNPLYKAQLNKTLQWKTVLALWE